MPTITKKKTKMIVKDGNGGLLQLLPETEVDVELDEESSNPVASSTVAEALSGIEDAASNIGAIKVMDEEPTALITTDCTTETFIGWMQPEWGWSITIDTEADAAGNKKTGIPFYLYGQDGITLTVDWGDGSTSTLTSADYTESDSSASIHEYAAPGRYTIKINSNDWENMYLFVTSNNTGIGASRYWLEKTLVSINEPLQKIKGTQAFSDNVINNRNNNFDLCFSDCSSLQFIPSGLFDKNTEVTSFRDCFYDCSSLQSIPAGLFDNNTAVTDFSGCFYNCESLQSIPSGLFDSNTTVTTFESCFFYCHFLSSIPAGLFDNNTAVTDFSYCFSDCEFLQSIPSRLFANNTAATDFSACFLDCYILQSIPEGLFDNCTAVESFSQCFWSCTSLTSIPAGLFDNNTAATDFSGCFEVCTSLTSIPAGLFDNNTAATDFSGCFSGCSSLQSIPAGLFDNNTAVESYGFNSCFHSCSSLQSIPSGLFDNNTAVTSFNYCFRGCSSLQSIPSGLFDKNTAVTSFYECFASCTSLTDFTLHIGSSLVSNCNNFVTNKSGTTRTIYVPSGSTTQTTFNSKASSLGLTIIGE